MRHLTGNSKTGQRSTGLLILRLTPFEGGDVSVSYRVFGGMDDQVQEARPAHWQAGELFYFPAPEITGVSGDDHFIDMQNEVKTLSVRVPYANMASGDTLILHLKYTTAPYPLQTTDDITHRVMATDVDAGEVVFELDKYMLTAFMSGTLVIDFSLIRTTTWMIQLSGKNTFRISPPLNGQLLETLESNNYESTPPGKGVILNESGIFLGNRGNGNIEIISYNNIGHSIFYNAVMLPNASQGEFDFLSGYQYIRFGYYAPRGAEVVFFDENHTQMGTYSLDILNEWFELTSTENIRFMDIYVQNEASCIIDNLFLSPTSLLNSDT